MNIWTIRDVVEQLVEQLDYRGVGRLARVNRRLWEILRRNSIYQDLITRREKVEPSRSFTDHCIYHGYNLRTVQWASRTSPLRPIELVSYELFVRPCRQGWLEIAQWVASMDPRMSPILLREGHHEAFRHGYLPVVQWLDPQVKYVCSLGSLLQHEDLFEWVAQRQPELLLRVDPSLACRSASWKILQIIAKAHPHFEFRDTHTLGYAVEQGQLDTINWILDPLPSPVGSIEQISIHSILSACWQGREDILRRLILAGYPLNEAFSAILQQMQRHPHHSSNLPILQLLAEYYSELFTNRLLNSSLEFL